MKPNILFSNPKKDTFFKKKKKKERKKRSQSQLFGPTQENRTCKQKLGTKFTLYSIFVENKWKFKKSLSFIPHFLLVSLLFSEQTNRDNQENKPKKKKIIQKPFKKKEN